MVHIKWLESQKQKVKGNLDSHTKQVNTYVIYVIGLDEQINVIPVKVENNNMKKQKSKITERFSFQ